MALTEKDTTKLNKSIDSVELTEAVVLTRTRAPDLESVKKLNCWASNIGDVSVVRRMPALEVCSLSINKITSLRDFAHCHHLKELYVRTNKIERLGDIHYLKHLRRLRSLWLAENPCAGDPNYRMTVLRTLPNLRKLDNIAVTEDEVQRAETEGDQIPIPQDFSFSSLFDVDAFSQKNGRGSSASPPNSARSMDSTRTTADSVAESVGISTQNSIADSMSVQESQGRWALPRRKRLQRKREEMLRSSGGEEGGGGSARSGEDSSGAGDGKRSWHVSGSSDSHLEEDTDVNCNGRPNSDDEVQKTVKNSVNNLDHGDIALKDSDADKVEITISSIRDSAGSANSKIDEESRPCDGVDERNPQKENDEGTFRSDGKSLNAIEVTLSHDLTGHPKVPNGPELAGSINVLRISELDETAVSEASQSGTNTLVQSTDAQSVQEDRNRNNYYGSHVTQQNKDINLNEISDDKCFVAPQTPVSLAKAPEPSFTKQSEHSLLDQIRLDDSLDVLDSAAEENSSTKQETVAPVIGPQQLEIKMEQGTEEKVTAAAVSEDQSRRTKYEPGSEADVSARVAGLTLPPNARQKPQVAIKPKAAQLNFEELNRMRLELGLKPMNSVRTSTPPTKPESEISQAKNSNVLTAVLCLLKELDKESLDIVGATVKARLEALG